MQVGVEVVAVAYLDSSMKCIRFDVCKLQAPVKPGYGELLLNEVHTF